MTTPKRLSSEQRRSYRCPVTSPQQTAELLVRRLRLPVRLVNESSGGFAAWVDQDPGVVTDDLVELRTDSGAFLVRVAYVGKVEPEPNDAAPQVETYRLGLERLREMAVSPDEKRRSAGRLASCALGSFFPSNTSIMVWAVTIVLLVALSVGGGMALLVHSNHPWVRHLSQRLGVTQGPRDSKPSKPLTLTHVSQELGLNASQESTFRQIAERTAQALQKLDAQWRLDDPQTRARKMAMLWNATRREILAMLTDEQRAQWRTLIESDPPDNEDR
jgi:hypothetical protein